MQEALIHEQRERSAAGVVWGPGTCLSRSEGVLHDVGGALVVLAQALGRRVDVTRDGRVDDCPMCGRDISARLVQLAPAAIELGRVTQGSG